MVNDQLPDANNLWIRGRRHVTSFPVRVYLYLERNLCSQEGGGFRMYWRCFTDSRCFVYESGYISCLCECLSSVLPVNDGPVLVVDRYGTTLCIAGECFGTSSDFTPHSSPTLRRQKFPLKGKCNKTTYKKLNYTFWPKVGTIDTIMILDNPIAEEITLC